VSPRDAQRALKLADGSFLIRTDCCRPGACAPAAGIRCCLSLRCACAMPTRTAGATMHYVNPPIRPASSINWPKTTVLIGSFGASGAIVVGTVLVIAAHIVAVVVTTGCVLVTLASWAWIRGRRGPKYIVNVHNR
jgi:hypothetical protein